jgi:hypothetical protein
MKSMKLYTNVQRIHNELAALGMGLMPHCGWISLRL